MKKKIESQIVQNRGWRWMAALVLVVMLAGCAAPPAPVAPTSDGSRSVTEPTPTPAPPEPTPTPEAAEEEPAPLEPRPRGGDNMTVGGRPTALIERAKTELAADASFSAEQVEVVSVEQVEWSDSSLGCPKAGMMYAQVITPGYRIVLAADGQTYEFHSGLDPAGPLVQCGQ